MILNSLIWWFDQFSEFEIEDEMISHNSVDGDYSLISLKVATLLICS